MLKELCHHWPFKNMVWTACFLCWFTQVLIPKQELVLVLQWGGRLHVGSSLPAAVPWGLGHAAGFVLEGTIQVREVLKEILG